MSPWRPWSGPLALEITAVFPRNSELLKVFKRTRAYKHPTHRLPFVQKPDADNIAKSACDALQKSGVIVDDKDIASLTIFKQYAAIGEQPHVLLRLSPLPNSGNDASGASP
jgi:Holliday junction resolvase RusA-like endonuclease